MENIIFFHNKKIKKIPYAAEHALCSRTVEGVEKDKAKQCKRHM
jgi:hypothetical protein